MSVGADGKMRLRNKLCVEAWSGHEWWSRLLSGMTYQNGFKSLGREEFKGLVVKDFAFVEFCWKGKERNDTIAGGVSVQDNFFFWWDGLKKISTFEHSRWK